MDYNMLVQAIGSVGFPIVACCIMFLQNNKMQETLSQLTATLAQMSDRLEDVENAIKEK